jgi:hypothetical protein
LIVTPLAAAKLALRCLAIRHQGLSTELDTLGYFSRGHRAFLHFHEDAGDFYVDVRLDNTFCRMKVTSREEQADLLARLRKA